MCPPFHRLLYKNFWWGGGVLVTPRGVSLYTPPMGVFGNGGVVVQMGGKHPPVGGGGNKSLRPPVSHQVLKGEGTYKITMA